MLFKYILNMQILKNNNIISLGTFSYGKVKKEARMDS